MAALPSLFDIAALAEDRDSLSVGSPQAINAKTSRSGSTLIDLLADMNWPRTSRCLRLAAPADQAFRAHTPETARYLSEVAGAAHAWPQPRHVHRPREKSIYHGMGDRIDTCRPSTGRLVRYLTDVSAYRCLQLLLHADAVIAAVVAIAAHSDPSLESRCTSWHTKELGLALRNRSPSKRIVGVLYSQPKYSNPGLPQAIDSMKFFCPGTPTAYEGARA